MSSTYKMKTAPYIGRFAPSPSGSLHFGSLISALASYLDAKHHHGKWLVRMEDIDPPREETGAKEKILASLQAHGLYWDDEVLYQSSRLSAYQQVLDSLDKAVYRCQCGRQRMLELRSIYDSRCQHTPPSNKPEIMTSVRVSLKALETCELERAEHYNDLFQGPQQQLLQRDVGDFILRRKDGLFAYQLAVICDDIYQGVNHIIRGSDLLSSTPRQRYLIALVNQILGTQHSMPIYGHIPVATNKIGQKLSKQHKATPLDDTQAFNNVVRVLNFLHQPPPENITRQEDITQLLQWAIAHWNRESIPQNLSFIVEE